MTMRFETVDRLVIGTVGLPGEREFYLQFESQGQTLSFAMEKGQAAALGEKVRELLREVRRRYGFRAATVPQDDAALSLPVESEFRILELSISWSETTERVILEGAGEGEESFSIAVTIDQAAEFARRTEQVVSAGRAPCPFCGLPLNIEGHLCPRANGYRR